MIQFQYLMIQQQFFDLAMSNLTNVTNQRKYSGENQAAKKQTSEIPNLDISLIENKKKTSEKSFKTSQMEFGSPILTGLISNPPSSPVKDMNINMSADKIKEMQNPPQKREYKKQQTLRSQKSLKYEQVPKQRIENSGSEQREFEMGAVVNWREVWLFVKLILFSYQFNLLQYLEDIDKSLTEKVINLSKISPGYKPVQYIYLFYMLKYGIVTGTLAAFVYPLPYSLLFLMITVDMEVPFVAIFMLAGMRSGAIALLLKYCLHFPKQIFHWVVLIFTVLIGTILPNNYIYLLLFAISIFLSFYIHKQQGRDSISVIQQQRQNQSQNPLMFSSFGFNNHMHQIYKEYKVLDGLPETYANVSICLICGAMILIWILQRYMENRELNIFGQLLPISLLVSSKQMLAFFPYIYRNEIGDSTLSANTLIGLSFLFPGPHSKAFMFFIYHDQIKNVLIGYTCLYLPSILLTNIFIGYRPHFFTTTYYNIRQSIQAVSNGIVFCLVYWMLQNEPCFFNQICYSAVVIMVVAKLYKLRELFAITLGIFLISSRTIILNINKSIPFEIQACLNQTLIS